MFGAEKLISRYNKLKHSLPLLTSALHCFGLTYGGSVTSRKGGNLQHGWRIAVQATAAGRRRKGLSRGKARGTPGKSLKGQPPAKKPLADDSRYVLPAIVWYKFSTYTLIVTEEIVRKIMNSVAICWLVHVMQSFLPITSILMAFFYAKFKWFSLRFSSISPL